MVSQICRGSTCNRNADFLHWVSMGAEKPLKKTSQTFYWDPSADIKVWMASRQAYEDHRNIVGCNQEESSSSRQCSFWSWEIGIMYSVTVLSSVLGSYFVQDKFFVLKYVYITVSDSLGLGIPGPKCCCLLGKGRRVKGNCPWERPADTILLLGCSFLRLCLP